MDSVIRPARSGIGQLANLAHFNTQRPILYHHDPTRQRRQPFRSHPMRRLLITTGLLIALAGFLWPWLSRLPIGRLPGDILIDRPGLKIYIPLMTIAHDHGDRQFSRQRDSLVVSTVTARSRYQPRPPRFARECCGPMSHWTFLMR